MDRPEEKITYERTLKRESKTIYTGKKFSVRIDTYTDETGHSYSRDIVEHPGAVVMVTVDKDGTLLMVRQWRRAAEKILCELPAGTLEKGEDPAECAQRELQEEIGYKAGKMSKLGGFYSAPGFCSEYLHLFLAEDLEVSQLEPDEGEAIELVRVTLDEAIAMIQDGRICDAKSIAGILQYKLRQSI